MDRQHVVRATDNVRKATHKPEIGAWSQLRILYGLPAIICWENQGPAQNGPLINDAPETSTEDFKTVPLHELKHTRHDATGLLVALSESLSNRTSTLATG
ncbi:hypothetical protein HDG32_002872 [Paraburkholderia sp. CI2]|uniref:hypothetical protein n=1 Tax=unclassified Paraburkholderia TaxID=2615204 RepID=UPI0016181FD1|nr:hypothetical protein [Paraburkholderia sp. CI2]